MNRPCIDCGAITSGTRCVPCEVVALRRRPRASATARGYDYRWRKLSERARRLQPFCAWCGATDDLTTDHRVPLAAAGTRRPTLADVLVLCRPCNSSRITREAPFRRFRLNQWVAAEGAWLPSGAWAACADPTRVVEPGTEVVVGFDGSYSGDSTALIGCTLDGFVFVLGCWENPNDPSWRVPRVEVDAAVTDAFDRYRVRRMACDPWGWRTEIEEWEARFGDDVVIEFPTNSLARIAPAADRFYQAVQLRSLTHDGDARLARHLTNAHVKSTTYGDVIVKDRRGSSRKIDLAVAAVVGFDQAHSLPPRRRARVVAF